MSDDCRKVKIVADHLGIDEAKVTEESSFIDDLGADSLDTVELVMAFEEEFGSEISDSEAEKILTVGDAGQLIEGKLIETSMPSKNDGVMIILSSPSGAGKTTLVNLLSKKTILLLPFLIPQETQIVKNIIKDLLLMMKSLKD